MGELFQIVSLIECAKMLGISLQRTRFLFNRSGFKPWLVIGQTRYFMRRDFEKWRKEQRR